MLKYKDVINAVDRGCSVYWSNGNYKIIKDDIGQYLIHSQSNNHYIGFSDSEYYLKDIYIQEEGECEHLMNPETCISCKDEKDYKPYTNIDNIVNDMLSVGGKK